MKCLEFRDVTNKVVVLGVRGVDADMQGVDWARSREGGQQLRGVWECFTWAGEALGHDTVGERHANLVHCCPPAWAPCSSTNTSLLFY
jgi:hypothetical protein